MAGRTLDYSIIISAVTRGLRDLDRMGSGLENINKKALALIAPLAGIGTAFLAVAKDMQEAEARIKSGAEVTGTQLEKLNKIAKRVWEKGAAESITAGADEVIKAFQKAGDVSEEQLFRIAKSNASLAARFNQDTDKLTSSAAAMVKNLGVTWDQAYDILAKGLRSGANIAADDLVETFSEYSTVMRDAGINAEQMYSIMVTGAGEGILGTDKVIDGIKEMGIKLAGMNDATQEALAGIGIDSVKMQAELANGTIKAYDAFKQIMVGIRGTDNALKITKVSADIFGSKFEDLGALASKEIDSAKFSMEDFNKSMDKVGAKYDTLQGKGLLMWRGFLSGLATGVEWLNEYVNVIIKSDNTTKALLATITAVIGSYVIWNLGLKILIGSLINVVVGINAQILAMRTAVGATSFLTGAFAGLTTAGQVLAASLGLIVVALAALAVGKLVTEILAARDAWELATIAQNNLLENSKKWNKATEAFKDFKMPENITGKTTEELIALKQQILSARLYWITMRNELEVKSKETSMGFLTKEAKAAKKELEKVDLKITGLSENLAKIGESSKGIDKVAASTKLSAKAMDDFEKAAKKAYEEATKSAEKYAKQVVDFEKKIQFARLSTEDKLRELGRKGLDEEKVWNDQKLQAEQKFADAKIALKNKDYELAEKLVQDAEALYAGLAVEISKEVPLTGKIEAARKAAEEIEEIEKISQGIQGVRNVEAQKKIEEELKKIKSDYSDKNRKQKIFDKEKELAEIKKLTEGWTKEDVELKTKAAEKENKIAISEAKKLLSELAKASKGDYDTQKQISEAKRALLQGDFDKAAELAKDLDQIQVKGIDKTKQTAIEGVTATGAFIEQLYTQQRDAAKATQTEYEASAATIKASLDELAAAKTAKIAPEIDDASLKLAQDEINKLTKDEVKIIKVKTVETKSSGGVAGFSTGGKLPGYSRRDTIPAMLTKGEWIINALSSRTLDTILPGFLSSLNRIKSPADLSRIIAKFASGVQKFRNGGIAIPMPRMPIQRFATGGQAIPLPAGFAAQQVPNMGSITLNIGGETGDIFGDQNLLKTMAQQLGRLQKRRVQ